MTTNRPDIDAFLLREPADEPWDVESAAKALDLIYRAAERLDNVGILDRNDTLRAALATAAAEVETFIYDVS